MRPKQTEEDTSTASSEVSDEARELGDGRIAEPGAGLPLEHLMEPSELRASLLEGALAVPPRDRTYPECLGRWLWERWGEALEPAGMSRAAFMEVVAGYRREVWFWLLGDRGWDPLLSGMAGRVCRRVDTS